MSGCTIDIFKPRLVPSLYWQARVQVPSSSHKRVGHRAVTKSLYLLEDLSGRTWFRLRYLPLAGRQECVPSLDGQQKKGHGVVHHVQREHYLCIDKVSSKVAVMILSQCLIDVTGKKIHYKQRNHISQYKFPNQMTKRFNFSFQKRNTCQSIHLPAVWQ